MRVGDRVSAILELSPETTRIVKGSIIRIEGTSLLVQTDCGTGWVEADKVFEVK